MRRPYPSSRNRQNGALLIVAMILLIVMTILALSSSQVVRLQERMAGNIRDTDMALQGSEAALRDGEEYIEGLTTMPSACTAPAASCNMYENAALINVNLATAAGSWWTTNSREYRTTSTKDLTTLNADPNYVIEKLDQVCDVAEGGCTESDYLYYFRITARSVGGSSTADVRLESTFVDRGG